MNEVNIYEILKEKPTSTKLYSPLYGKCKFSKLAGNMENMEAIWTESGNSGFAFNKFGRYMPNGECLLFPSKVMRDWSKLTWKKGDVLISVDGLGPVIFDGFVDDEYLNFNGKYLYSVNGEIRENAILATLYYQKTDSKEHIEFVENKLGGKLNLETLEIEKANFKDGDILMYSFELQSEKKVCCPLIFKEYINDSQFSSYAMKDAEGGLAFNYKEHSRNNTELRLASDKEKRNFLSFLTSKGYHWNADKKSVDKLVVSDKFYYFEMENELSYIAKLSKVEGHKFYFDGCVSWNARHSVGGKDFDPSPFEVEDRACFGFREATEDECVIFRKEQGEIALNFKLFDKVLARDDEKGKWLPALYLKSIVEDDGNILNKVFYLDESADCICNYCIPYNGNEHLAFTNDEE